MITNRELIITSETIIKHLDEEELLEYNREKSLFNVKTKELLKFEFIELQNNTDYPALFKIYRDCNTWAYKYVCQLQGGKRTETSLINLGNDGKVIKKNSLTLKQNLDPMIAQSTL